MPVSRERIMLLRGAAFVTGIVVLSAATLYQLKHHCEQYYTDAAA